MGDRSGAFRLDVPLGLRACRQLRLRRAESVLALCLGTVLSVPVTAGTFVPFSRTFPWTPGQSTTATFDVLNPNTAYTLEVRNGPGVPRALIQVNGRQVLGPADFQQPTNVISRPVSLQSSNQISVGFGPQVGRPSGTISLRIVGIDTDLPSIVASVSPLANSAGWNNTDVTVNFACDDATSGVGSCSPPVVVTTDGTGILVSGRAVDRAGNTASATVTLSIDRVPPIVTSITEPLPNDAGWNNEPVTVMFACSDALSGVASCALPVTFSVDGAGQIATGVGTDVAGNTASTDASANVDQSAPTVEVTFPPHDVTQHTPDLTLIGNVSEDVSGLSGVTCNGAAAIVSEGTFECASTLPEGPSTIVVEGIDLADNTATASRTITFLHLPEVAITSPPNLSWVNISPTTVTGTVDDPTAAVTVNAITAAVVDGGFSVAIPLGEGPNVVTASASTLAGAVGSHSIQVTLDTTPPHVTITSPPEDFVTTDSTIAVAGIINDIVVGTVNEGQAEVTVNGLAAQVANRTFLANGVELALGANTIQAIGRDQVGNAAITEIVVTREAPGDQPRIVTVSGNGQSGEIGSNLPEPLVVALVDGTGDPVPDQPVVFKVTQNDGLVATDGPPAGSLVTTTDAQGQAQVDWTLGNRAGAGANALEAYAIGFEGTALFTATATQGPAGRIVVDSGNAQTGVIGEPLPKPLIAVVVDSGNNRLGGVPVTFAVIEGGGNFDGGPSFTVNTDSDGRTAATLTLGPLEGDGNNLVEVTFPSNEGFPVAFTASGRVSGDPTQTTISGVVLDNSNVPIPGVMIRAVLTDEARANQNAVREATAVPTDSEGQFVIPEAPVGFVKILVDGATAELPGQYPALEYDLVTVAGQDNTVGMPIYLLPLNTDNQLCVSADSGGGTLALPEAPGFSLTFGPGQVTFPGGSRSGCVSVTVVHSDKVPMVPGFGQQPRFIVTIQPAGAVFNPPAPITLPNVDGLSPRAVTEMYSFDHDIGSFVAIGTGTVSEDGLVIRSDPGVGVLKAGWHCGGDPAANGTVADCPQCKYCQNNTCVTDPGQNNASCDDSNACTTSDRCAGGACIGGAHVNCDDGNACTEDSCDTAAGCKHKALPCCAGQPYDPSKEGCCEPLGAKYTLAFSCCVQAGTALVDKCSDASYLLCDLKVPRNSNCPYNPTSDGCSAPLIGDIALLSGVNFRTACDIHDFCYGMCGSDKASCDTEFRNNLNSICDGLPVGDPRFPDCLFDAEVFYDAVNNLGGGNYDAAQGLACWQCCP